MNLSIYLSINLSIYQSTHIFIDVDLYLLGVEAGEGGNQAQQGAAAADAVVTAVVAAATPTLHLHTLGKLVNR